MWPPARETCRASSDAAGPTLAKARKALGLDRPATVLRLSAYEITVHNYESDRPYRPYLASAGDQIRWVDLATGVTRDSTTNVMGPRGVVLSGDRTAVTQSDSGWHQNDIAWTAAERKRAFEAPLVVRAWSASPDVRVVGRCLYKDYDRIVLERSGVYGPERLYIDPKTGFLAKLDRDEPHYLWGQNHVEYVYATWNLFGDLVLPVSTTRVIDGDEEVVRTITDVTHVRADSAPSLALAAATKPSAVELPLFLHPAPVDTVRLGPHTYVLKNRGYNEVISLEGDTVYVLDATQSETRARTDSAWIGRLFPGPHPVVVVVTDLAWPHVAGVRFWVASGATIVSRDISRDFLRAVVARQWTLHPDKLAATGARTPFRFRAVHDSLVTPHIALYAINGIGSEGALMAFLPGLHVLWASDFVQQLQAPALYTAEVYAAACRVGIAPTRVVGEHQPVADWSTLTTLVQSQPLAGPASFAPPGRSC